METYTDMEVKELENIKYDTGNESVIADSSSELEESDIIDYVYNKKIDETIDHCVLQISMIKFAAKEKKGKVENETENLLRKIINSKDVSDIPFRQKMQISYKSAFF